MGIDICNPQLTFAVIEDAAHWVQREKPPEVVALQVRWLVDDFDSRADAG